MDRPRVIRSLRIAVSAVFGILCLLLIVYWVMSYNDFGTTEPFAIAGTAELTVELYHGQIALILSTPLPPGHFMGWLVDYPPQNGNKLPGIAGFALVRSPIADVLTFPFWFPVLLTVTAGAAPYLPWRFSLRTMLIVTTLIALVLGLAVWSSS